MEWTEVDGLSMEEAKSLVGVTIRWRTPRRRISPSAFSSQREGVMVRASPRGCLVVRVDRTHAKSGTPLQPKYYAPRLSSIIAVSKVKQNG